MARPPKTNRFSYQGLGISVETTDPASLAWLEEFLVPAFAPAGGNDADCHVALVDDEHAYEDAVRRTSGPAGTPMACFTLEGGLVRFPSWTWSAGERVILDEDSQVFYLVDSRCVRVRVLADRPRPSRRIAWMRVVREFATAHAWGAESLVVHGAAVEVGGSGIMIAGPKGAGKTSLLLHLLLHAPGTRFVSNDRVVVDLETAPVMRGMPTVATIKPQTLGLFPELEPRLSRRHYDARLALAETTPASAGAPRLGLAPAQLCEIVGADMRGCAPATVLLLPRLSVDDEGIRLTPLSTRAAADAVKANLIGGRPIPGVSEAFRAARHDARGIDPATLDRLSLALAEQARCFECRLGRNAYGHESARRLVDRVLGLGR